MMPAGVEIYVCTSPIDMRWSFDRLGGVVRESFGREPTGGALFIFFGKRRNGVTLCTHLFNQMGGEWSNPRDIVAMSSVGARAPA
jgi:hypothetical protein